MTAIGPAEWEAVRLSLWVALWATLCSLPLALLCAFALVRGRFWGRGALNILVHLPLVMPPVVTGYLLLLTFGRRGPVGGFLEQAFGLVFAFRWTGAALAAAVMGFPLMVRAMRMGIAAVDRRLEDAAATLGASRWRVFATITLPLAAPGVLAGAILGFAKALGEFGATITFVSNIPGQTRTIPLAINAALDVPGGEPLALSLALVSVGLAALALVASEWVARRLSDRGTL